MRLSQSTTASSRLVGSATGSPRQLVFEQTLCVEHIQQSAVVAGPPGGVCFAIWVADLARRPRCQLALYKRLLWSRSNGFAMNASAPVPSAERRPTELIRITGIERLSTAAFIVDTGPRRSEPASVTSATTRSGRSLSISSIAWPLWMPGYCGGRRLRKAEPGSRGLARHHRRSG
jgi:hypothetical protein